MSEPEPPPLAALRREYAAAGLHEDDASADPWEQFSRWLADALASGMHEPNAMVLSTVAVDGCPSSRMVLLKGYDASGFVFFTNLGSRKGSELEATPACSLLFPWHPLERQVRVTGDAQRLHTDEVATYFATRPRGAQVGAWASRQSRPVADRAELDAAYAREEERFADGPVPVPPYWGGFRVRPRSMEFWQGRPGRMHDRLEYLRSPSDPARWDRRRLAP